MASDSVYLERSGQRRAGQRQLNSLALNVGAAFESLRGNWFRAGLTVLGVVIGVAAVIVLVAFGQGARQEITGQIDTLGMNVAALRLAGNKLELDVEYDVNESTAIVHDAKASGGKSAG